MLWIIFSLITVIIICFISIFRLLSQIRRLNEEILYLLSINKNLKANTIDLREIKNHIFKA